MKKILLVISLMLMTSMAYCADQVITITIPAEKVAVALQGFLALYPNDEKNPDMTPKYTDKQWVAEQLRRLLVRDIRRGTQKLREQAVQVENDDTIATVQ